jgi:hypothetical protein
MSGKQLFYVKAAVGLVAAIPLFWFCASTIESTLERFGGLGFIHWIIGLGALGLGLLGSWATGIGIIDRRALSRYRASPNDAFEDGQVVVLSGSLRVDGEPLVAPFSRTACAAHSYRISGQRRRQTSTGTDTRAQLCMLGIHLAPAISRLPSW